MSQKVDVLPLVPAPSGLQVYGAKDGLDYRIPVGSPLGLPYLDVTGKIPSSLLPAPTAPEGPTGQTVEEHVAETDPHPQYTTAAEAAAAAPVQSVAGRSGAVVLVAADLSNASSAGLALIVAADASAQRSALGLGGAATLAVGNTAGTVCAGDDARLSDARTPTAHTHALSDLLQSGATVGQVVAWSGTAWAPATLSASPAGSGTELQYRNGSAFGAAAGTVWDSETARLGLGVVPLGTLHVQSGSASVVPLIVQMASSATAAAIEVRNSAGTTLLSALPSGRMAFGASANNVGSLRNSSLASPGVDCVSGDGTQWGNFYTQGAMYAGEFRTLGAGYMGGLGNDIYAGAGVGVGGFRANRFALTSASSFTVLTALYGGTGAPSNSDGADGEFYFRSDGAASTTIYHKRAGAWVGVV